MATVALAATQPHFQAMLLQAALARFQSQLRAHGRSPHTVAKYARHVRRFGEWLDAEGVADDVRALEPEHVAAFVAAADEQRRRDRGPRRAGSLNALPSSLRGFFAYLETSGIVERSPARVLRKARVAPTAPRGMCAADVAKLVAVLAAVTSPAGRRDHALVAFLARTGARLGSALALDVEFLDLAAGTATLRELKGGGARRTKALEQAFASC